MATENSSVPLLLIYLYRLHRDKNLLNWKQHVTLDYYLLQAPVTRPVFHFNYPIYVVNRSRHDMTFLLYTLYIYICNQVCLREADFFFLLQCH